MYPLHDADAVAGESEAMKSTAEMTAAPEIIFTGRMLATSKSHGGLLDHWVRFDPIHDDDEEREALRDKGLTLTIHRR